MPEILFYPYDQFLSFIKEKGARIISGFTVSAPSLCPVIEVYKTQDGKYFLHWIRKDQDGSFSYMVLTLE